LNIPISFVIRHWNFVISNLPGCGAALRWRSKCLVCRLGDCGDVQNVPKSKKPEKKAGHFSKDLIHTDELRTNSQKK